MLVCSFSLVKMSGKETCMRRAVFFSRLEMTGCSEVVPCKQFSINKSCFTWFKLIVSPCLKKKNPNQNTKPDTKHLSSYKMGELYSFLWCGFKKGNPLIMKPLFINTLSISVNGCSHWAKWDLHGSTVYSSPQNCIVPPTHLFKDSTIPSGNLLYEFFTPRKYFLVFNASFPDFRHFIIHSGPAEHTFIFV